MLLRERGITRLKALSLSVSLSGLNILGTSRLHFSTSPRGYRYSSSNGVLYLVQATHHRTHTTGLYPSGLRWYTTTGSSGRDGLDKDKEAEEFDTEESHEPERFHPYEPEKFKMGSEHPDPLVQSTSLKSVDPPDITYELRLPHSVQLSGPQLEAINYASQSHRKYLLNGDRMGFLLGDGTGVGKGRTLAGVILENSLQGRTRHVWISASSELQVDAEHDLRDIGADIPCANMNPLSKGSTIDMKEGVLFCTYQTLVRPGRIDQILEWCGDDFDGVIVLDECHKAQNNTKTAEKVMLLQDSLPMARIVYSSATGASNAQNMSYMKRLGLWGSEGTSFRDFDAFDRSTKDSVDTMELVAMHLKSRGAYVCRTLSYVRCTFEIIKDAVAPDLVAVYNKSALLWQKLFIELDTGIDSGKYVFTEESEEDNKTSKLSVMKNFWGAHQRFFRSLVVSLKVPCAVALTKQALQDGKCVVIGLQSTGGSAIELATDQDEMAKFVSVPALCLQQVKELCFPKGCPYDEKIEELSKFLPGNPIDTLMSELGGERCVAEMTGRKIRQEIMLCGKVEKVPRNVNGTSYAKQNLHERTLFMDGEKLVAIISEAASTGISLHADKRAANQRKRVHITLELSWSANKTLQQLGRSHRSNQSSAPEYKLLISAIGGENRFLMATAKRLQTLGALLQGDRNALDSSSMGLSEFNFDTKHGKEALKTLMQRLYDMGEKGGVNFGRGVCSWLGLVGITISNAQKLTVDVFLNRLLGLEVEHQQIVFDLYIEVLEQVIRSHKLQGVYDTGIRDLGNDCFCKTPAQILYKNVKTGEATYQITVSVDRSIPWAEAEAFVKEAEEECARQQESIKCDMQHEIPVIGFYRRRGSSSKQSKDTTLLAVREKPCVFKGMPSKTLLCKAPLMAHSKSEVDRTRILAKYEKISANVAKDMWENELLQRKADRVVDYKIITGDILFLYGVIQRNLQMKTVASKSTKKMQIVRAMLPASSIPGSGNMIPNQGARKYMAGVLVPDDIMEYLVRDIKTIFAQQHPNYRASPEARTPPAPIESQTKIPVVVDAKSAKPKGSSMTIAAIDPHYTSWSFKATDSTFLAYLIDDAGTTIRCSFFGKQCENYFPLLEEGKTYIFSGDKVAPSRNSDFNYPNSITFNSKSSIKPYVASKPYSNLS